MDTRKHKMRTSLKSIEDALLAMQADKIVEKDDWLGPAASEALLAEITNADN